MWLQRADRLAMYYVSILLVFVMSGCGNGAGASPSEQAARAALDKALKTWSTGGKPGELPGADPAVVVHDTPWSQGEQLESYEILREEQAGPVEKQFAVRLSMTKPQRTDEVRYHVLGVGPLMVFRDQDYQRNINMENGPSLTRSGKQARKPR